MLRSHNTAFPQIRECGAQEEVAGFLWLFVVADSAVPPSNGAVLAERRLFWFFRIRHPAQQTTPGAHPTLPGIFTVSALLLTTALGLEFPPSCSSLLLLSTTLRYSTVAHNVS
jgi:hypothetical protein